jgi:hypothetical protein
LPFSFISLRVLAKAIAVRRTSATPNPSNQNTMPIVMAKKVGMVPQLWGGTAYFQFRILHSHPL